jgi:enoyl-CoA hydratase/carnithine racemase
MTYKMNELYETIDVELRAPFAFITLNRPDVRNAMNQQMVSDLRKAFAMLEVNREIRGIVLTGAGNTFCSGGDLHEMQAAYTASHYDSTNSTANFDQMLEAIVHAPQVVIARVNGAAMGGGLGLVCAADIAIASTDAVFGFPEVRLGIVPALISPYVIAQIGQANARRLMLTGTRFNAEAALAYGFVTSIHAPGALDEAVEAILAELRLCAPGALAACKRLINHIAAHDFSATSDFRAQLLDERRRSAEGQEGMQAFISRRKPEWAQHDDGQ